jgi:hypothetical protein
VQHAFLLTLCAIRLTESTQAPSAARSSSPTEASAVPTLVPTLAPTPFPTIAPTSATPSPSATPSATPTVPPTAPPTAPWTGVPSFEPESTPCVGLGAGMLAVVDVHGHYRRWSAVACAPKLSRSTRWHGWVAQALGRPGWNRIGALWGTTGTTGTRVLRVLPAVVLSRILVG